MNKIKHYRNKTLLFFSTKKETKTKKKTVTAKILFKQKHYESLKCRSMYVSETSYRGKESS